MKKLVLTMCNATFLVLSPFPAICGDVADAGPLTTKPTQKSARATNDDESEPSEPTGMKLVQPNFSLPGLKATDSQPTAQLQLTSAVMTNSDVADTSSGSSAKTDAIFYNGAALSLTPRLTDGLRLNANINGGFIRYNKFDLNDYDTLNANLGLMKRLGDDMTGELGWRYSQYYAGHLLGTNQNLQEQGLRFALNRVDMLPYDSFVQTSYEFQTNYSNPVDRSRLSHYLTGGLGHNFTNELQAMIFYRFRHDDFTNRSFFDTSDRHEIQGQLAYFFNKYVYVAATVSYLFGDTVDLLQDKTAVAYVRPNPTAAPRPTTIRNDKGVNDLSNVTFGFRIQANVPLLD